MHRKSSKHGSYQQPLRYGDTISFQTESGFLCVISDVEDRAFVRRGNDVEQPTDFEECLFQVEPVQVYSMQRRFSETIKALGLKRFDPRLPPPDLRQADIQLLRELHARIESEIRQNKTETSKAIGLPISFGAGVQLLHLQSDRYLAVSSESAKIDTTNNKVTLDSPVNRNSSFTMEPSFKLQSEGDTVRIGDCVFLRSQRHSSFIRPSYDPGALFPDSGELEVNACVIPDKWRIRSFASAVRAPVSTTVTSKIFHTQAKQRSTSVQAGDVICLFHREIEAYLAYNSTRNGFFPFDRVKYSVFGPEALSSDCFFRIELANVTTGGEIEWEEHIKLRHIGSNLYVRISDSLSLSWNESIKNTPRPLQLDLTKNGQEPGCIWRFTPVVPDHSSILYESLVRLQNVAYGCFLSGLFPSKSPYSKSRSSPSADKKFTLSTVPSDGDAFSFSTIPKARVNDLIFVQRRLRVFQEFLFKLENISLQWAQRLNSLSEESTTLDLPDVSCNIDESQKNSGFPHVVFQSEFQKEPKNSTATPNHPNATETSASVHVEMSPTSRQPLHHTSTNSLALRDLDFVCSCLQDCIAFCFEDFNRGEDSSVTKFLDDALFFRQVISSRQNLIKERYMLDILLQLVDIPFQRRLLDRDEVERYGSYLAREGKSFSSKELRLLSYPHGIDAEREMPRPGFINVASKLGTKLLDVVHLSYKLIQCCIRENEDTKKSLNSHVPHLQCQSSLELGTTELLIECYKDNEDLLRSMNEADIQFIIDREAESGPTERNIAFLCELLMFHGNPVVKNQNLVCDCLLETRPDLLFHLLECTLSKSGISVFVRKRTFENAMRSPRKSACEEEEGRGLEILRDDGSNSSDQFHMIPGVHESVSITDPSQCSFDPSTSDNHTRMDLLKISEKTESIEHRFLALQLRLFTLLSSRRNSTVQVLLRRSISPSLLLTCITRDNLSLQFRTQFLLLFRNLYLDTDPFDTLPRLMTVRSVSTTLDALRKSSRSHTASRANSSTSIKYQIEIDADISQSSETVKEEVIPSPDDVLLYQMRCLETQIIGNDFCHTVWWNSSLGILQPPASLHAEFHQIAEQNVVFELFAYLNEFLSSHVRISYSAQEMNQFLSAILDVIDTSVDLGFFAFFSSPLSLVSIFVELLHCGSDIIPRELGDEIPKGDDHAKNFFSIKTRICSILDKLLDIRLNLRVSRVLPYITYLFHEDQSRKSTFFDKDFGRGRDSLSFGKSLHPYKEASIAESSFSSYTTSETFSGSFPKSFAFSNGSAVKPSITNVALNEAPISSLLRCREVLLDLCEFPWESLRTTSLKLLFRLYEDERELFDMLDSTTFVVSQQKIRLFRNYSDAIIQGIKKPILRGNLCTQDVMNMVDVYKSFIMDLQSQNYIKWRQDTLLSLGFYKWSIESLQAASLLRVFDRDSNSNSMDLTDSWHSLVAMIYHALALFVRGNRKNQSVAVEHISLFLAHLKHGIECSEFIFEIFSGNRQLCMHVDEEFVENVISLIRERGKKSQYLEILKALLVVDGRPVPRNQRLIFEALLRMERDTMVLFSDSEGIRNRRQLMSEDSTICPEGLLSYHISLLDLLSLCASGKVHVIESRMQSLLSLDQVFRLALDPECLLPVKSSIIGFLYEVFMDVEGAYPFNERSSDSLRLFENFLVDVDKFLPFLMFVSRNPTHTQHSPEVEKQTTLRLPSLDRLVSESGHGAHKSHGIHTIADASVDTTVLPPLPPHFVVHRARMQAKKRDRKRNSLFTRMKDSRERNASTSKLMAHPSFDLSDAEEIESEDSQSDDDDVDKCDADYLSSGVHVVSITRSTPRDSQNGPVISLDDLNSDFGKDSAACNQHESNSNSEFPSGDINLEQFIKYCFHVILPVSECIFKNSNPSILISSWDHVFESGMSGSRIGPTRRYSSSTTAGRGSLSFLNSSPSLAFTRKDPRVPRVQIYHLLAAILRISQLAETEFEIAQCRSSIQSFLDFLYSYDPTLQSLCQRRDPQCESPIFMHAKSGLAMEYDTCTTHGSGHSRNLSIAASELFSSISIALLEEAERFLQSSETGSDYLSISRSNSMKGRKTTPFSSFVHRNRDVTPTLKHSRVSSLHDSVNDQMSMSARRIFGEDMKKRPASFRTSLRSLRDPDTSLGSIQSTKDELANTISEYASFARIEEEHERRISQLLNELLSNERSVVLHKSLEECTDLFQKEKQISQLLSILRYSAPKDELLHVNVFSIRILTRILMRFRENQAMLIERQNLVSDLGGHELLTELVTSKNTSLCNEAIRFGIALFLDGNLHVQGRMHEFLVSETFDELFFKKLKSILRNSVEELRQREVFEHRKAEVENQRRWWTSFSMKSLSQTKQMAMPSSNVKFRMLDVDDINLDDLDDFKETHNVVEVLRLLQLFCEGHCLFMQDMLREQIDNAESVDLVTETVNFFADTKRRLESVPFEVTKQCLATITDFIQGPCIENQRAVGFSKFLYTINSLFEDDRESLMLHSLSLLELKNSAVISLLSLLEGSEVQGLVDLFVDVLDISRLEQILRLLHEELVQLVHFIPSKRNWVRELHVLEEDDLLAAKNDLAMNIFFLFSVMRDHLIETNSPKILRVDLEEFLFLREITGSVEIVREKRLEKVYFPVPKKCFALTERTKEDFLNNANRETSTSKIESLLDSVPMMRREMTHQYTLSKNSYYSLFLSLSGQASILSFYIAIIINLLLLFSFVSYPGPNSTRIVFMRSGILEKIVLTLGIILGSIALQKLLLHIFSVGFTSLKNRWTPRITNANRWEDQTRNFFFYARCYYLYLTEAELVYHTFYFIFCLLGVFYSPFFFSFHLTEFVVRFPILQNVIKSVTESGASLALTFLLMLIIIFFFTVVAFLGFNEEFTSKVDRTPLCDNLLSCFLWIFNYGLRSAAFMEDAFLTERTVPRLIFDLLFFFLVIILALNLIFGIILDNFGKLRQKKNEIERDKENRCFVCSMDRSTLERYGDGFEKHTTYDHNIWSYLFFFIHLLEKDQTEYTGAEQYIWDRLSTGETNFMPVQRALVLEQNQRLRNLRKGRQMTTDDIHSDEEVEIEDSSRRMIDLGRPNRSQYDAFRSQGPADGYVETNTFRKQSVPLCLSTCDVSSFPNADPTVRVEQSTNGSFIAPPPRHGQSDQGIHLDSHRRTFEYQTLESDVLALTHSTGTLPVRRLLQDLRDTLSSQVSDPVSLRAIDSVFDSISRQTSLVGPTLGEET